MEKGQEKPDTVESEKDEMTGESLNNEEKKDEGTEKSLKLDGRDSPICLDFEEEESFAEDVSKIVAKNYLY